MEGNSLTLGKTRSLLLHGLTAAGKPPRDHLDIKGHNEAVRWLEDFVRDERPLTEQFIRRMHKMLLDEAYEVPAQTPDGQPTRRTIRPGQYKTSPNNVLTATDEMSCSTRCPMSQEKKATVKVLNIGGAVPDAGSGKLTWLVAVPPGYRCRFPIAFRTVSELVYSF